MTLDASRSDSGPARPVGPSAVGLLSFALGLLLLGMAPAAGQEKPAHRSGILEEIRSRIAGRPEQEVWEAARRSGRAQDALPLMEELASRGGESVYAPRAALWIGHYRYASGQIEPALASFEQALAWSAPGEGEYVEAYLWSTQCRGLLGQGGPAEDGPRADTTEGVLADLVGHDGELRNGRLQAALRGYLALETSARRAGCLGPLLYRVGLVAASFEGAGGRSPVDPSAVRRLEAEAPTSPERALVAALLTAANEQKGDGEGSRGRADSDGTAGGPTAGSGALSPTAPGPSFAEPGSAPEGTGIKPGEEGGAPGIDSVRTDAGAPGGEIPVPPGAESGSGRSDASPPGASQSAIDPWTLQLGAYHNIEGARRALAALAENGVNARLDADGPPTGARYRIHLGHFPSREEALAAGRRLPSGVDWRPTRIIP